MYSNVSEFTCHVHVLGIAFHAFCMCYLHIAVLVVNYGISNTIVLEIL